MPLQALREQPGADADPEGTVREAIETIREDCPQHSDAADGLQVVLNQQPAERGGQGPGDAALQACVEQTGQTVAQCREQAASGGAS